MPRSATSTVYCTWSYRQSLPPSLRSKFQDLDHFVRTLCSSAKTHLLLVAPYLSPAGLSALRGPIAVSVVRGAWVRLLTGNLERPNGLNRRALRALVSGDDGAIVSNRLRILTGTETLPALIHAKIILSDQKGYLGSANFSQGGMDSNFELGVALSKAQVVGLERLLAFFEAQGSIIDCTDMILS